MSETLFSPSWYRVDKLKPRLRSHARIHRHRYGGRLWYVLQDPSSGRHHRLSPAAHTFVGLMDGRRSVGEIWHIVSTRLGDEAPTQDEVIRLLGMLHSSDLLASDVAPDSLEMFRRFQHQEKSRWKQRLMSPLSLRFPLFDPDRFLSRWAPLLRPMFSWPGAVVWATVVGVAILLAAVHWPELSAGFGAGALDPGNLLLLAIVYPLLKVMHELGHGFATRAWGGEVHEVGIAFLVMLPIPYVDASSASAFRERRRRIVVGAAGMMVELLAASLALFVWLAVEPGTVRSLAQNVMLLGAVSTLVFNGNPLLRFDGYYILADAIDIPNLSTRSTRHLGYLVQRHLFGVRDTTSPAITPWERRWFVAYGIGSFLYRIFIMLVIILIVGGRFFAVGAALAIWAAITQIVVPVMKKVDFVLRSPELRRNRTRAMGVSATAILIALVGVVLAPLPSWTRAEGVVWLPERSHVRAGVDGFVQHVPVKPGMWVRAGDPLIETADALQVSRLKVLDSRLRELRVQRAVSWSADPAEAELIKEEIAAVEAEIADARERSQQAIILSPTDGTLVLLGAHALLGRLLHQGELVGYVTDFSGASARVVVPQADAGMVRERTRGVEVRLADRPGEVLPSAILREVPAASDRLPSAVLGTQGGGRFALDPADDEGTRVLAKVFQFELALPAEADVEHAGMRVYVRFDHGSESLAVQCYRSLRRLFLRRFGV